MAEIRTVIFDFDGTLADTLDKTVEIYNSIAHEYNCKQLKEEDKEQLRNRNPHEFIRDYGVTLLKLPIMVLRMRRELACCISEIKPISGICEALRQIKEASFNLGILTSNSKENVKAFLERNALSELFDFIYTGKNLLGKDKVIKRLIASKRLNKNSLVYVGDELRDIEAAKKTGIPVVAVGWGFNAKEILLASRPNKLAKHPYELLDCIGQTTGNI